MCLMLQMSASVASSIQANSLPSGRPPDRDFAMHSCLIKENRNVTAASNWISPPDFTPNEIGSERYKASPVQLKITTLRSVKRAISGKINNCKKTLLPSSWCAAITHLWLTAGFSDPVSEEITWLVRIQPGAVLNVQLAQNNFQAWRLCKRAKNTRSACSLAAVAHPEGYFGL